MEIAVPWTKVHYIFIVPFVALSHATVTPIYLLLLALVVEVPVGTTLVVTVSLTLVGFIYLGEDSGTSDQGIFRLLSS